MQVLVEVCNMKPAPLMPMRCARDLAIHPRSRLPVPNIQRKPIPSERSYTHTLLSTFFLIVVLA